MGEIPNKVKENVRAVLLSKTDGKGVLTTDFLKDYKSILKVPLMFKSLGFSSLKEFLNAIPDVCRLEYNENVMAFKMFGIAKPNTYASSFMKKAEGNTDVEDDDEKEERGPRRGGRTGNSRTGELLSLGKDLNEDWQPNCRGLFTLCFPNKFSHLSSNEAVTVKFSEVGEVADVNIIPSLIFVRFHDCDAAKQAISLWGDELKLRRADEKQPPGRQRREDGDRGGGRGSDRGGGRGSDRGGGRGGNRDQGRSRGDRDEMLVNSRPRRDNRGGNTVRKQDSDEDDDWGGKPGRQNGHANTDNEGKKESIWAKVRQADGEEPKEIENVEIRASVTEKEQFDSNQNQIFANDIVKSVQNNLHDMQGSTWSKKPEVTNAGLIGRHPEDMNSHLLDSIVQPPDNQGKGLLGEGPSDLRSTATMNGLLASPMVPVPLGRATILGRQATGHSSYVNPGPISRPSASSIMTQSQKTSPGIQQGQANQKFSPSAISPAAPTVVDTQKPNSIRPREDPRAAIEKVTDNKTDEEKTIQVYIGNFPYTAKQEDLEELLKKYSYTSCKIVSAKTNAYKKYAFVDFVSQKEAEQCIEDLNQFEFQSRNLQVRFGSRKSEDEKEGMKISPKPSQQLSPNIQNSPKQVVVEEEDDDDEMPELETNTPVITRTITNDKVRVKKTNRQPGAYVPKSPEKMPPLEQVSPISPISPRMPPLEQKSPPKRRQPLLPTPVPQMPQPGSAKVFDSRDLEEKMLHSEKEEGDESIQLVLTNFPYGTHESELFEMFKDYTVHQINMMNSNVTNRSTYAFVTVKNIEQAQLAILQLDQSLMKGRRLTVGMVTPTTAKKSNLAEPIARITCTVGAQGDTGRHVSVDKSSVGGSYMPDARGDYMADRGHMMDRGGYNTDRGHMTDRGYMSGYQSDGYQSESGYGNQSEGGYGYKSEGSYSRPDFDRPRQSLQEDNRKTNMRMTHILKSYAMITSKLHGEQDFMQPPHSQMTVHVTHVEDNGYFFWGQVLVDPARRESYGPRKNIETLKRITFELQEEKSRPGPLQRLGRCAALYQGEWYRAWNLGVFDDGMHDIIYLDYGNTEAVPNEELCDTIPAIWNIPPIAKPFRAVDAVKTKFGTMKGLENKNVTIEIIKPGESQSNFVANVHLVDVHEHQ